MCRVKKKCAHRQNTNTDLQINMEHGTDVMLQMTSSGWGPPLFLYTFMKISSRLSIQRTGNRRSMRKREEQRQRGAKGVKNDLAGNNNSNP